MKKIALLGALIGSTLVSGQSYISKIYCALLGSVDVDQHYKELAYAALKEYGIARPEDVAIKKMNILGSIIAGVPLSSFTAFGIWLDQDYLDSCSQDEKIFSVYHEAAHYVHRHHQKTLEISAVLGALAGTGLVAFNRFLNKQGVPYCGALTAGATLMTAIIVYGALLPCIVKQQEKEADMEACKKLISINKSNIIKDRIQKLREPVESDGILWWFSNNEQAEYLENTLRS